MGRAVRQVYEAVARYMMPDVALVPSELPLLFGTRHGVDTFVADTVRLWERKMFKRIIVSGGRARGSAETEAESIGTALIGGGIPKERVLLETEAKNTPQNVCFSLDVLRERHIETSTTVMGIGKLCSLRRYYMTLARYWPHTKGVCVHRVNYFGVPISSWWKNDEFRTRVFGELSKIELYASKGDLVEVELD